MSAALPADPAGLIRKEAVDEDPLEVLVDLLCGVETSLSREKVWEVAAEVVQGRARQRALAPELINNPQVLRTGLSPCAVRVGTLLMALKKAGTEQLAHPGCHVCGHELVNSLAKHARTWGHTRCFRKPETCTACGEVRAVRHRDRYGQPCCERCPLPEHDDPTNALVKVLAGLEPGLSRDRVLEAQDHSGGMPALRRDVAWAVVECPSLLTGQAAAPTLGVLRFIDALVRAGADSVVVPPCPGCGQRAAGSGQRRTLTQPVNGQRMCDSCVFKARSTPCARCGMIKPKYRRDEGGTVLCQSCWDRDPRNWEVCPRCGNRRRVAGSTAAGAVCQTCRPRPDRTCAICGHSRKGTISQAINKHVCDRCKSLWVVCSKCGAGAVVRGGTREMPLCARCVNPDPTFWKRCRTCKTTWQLTTAPCTRCSLDARLRTIFASPGGSTAPELDRLRERLVQVDRPSCAITWLHKPNVQATITTLAREHRVITHAALDTMPQSKTLAHFRSLLVSVGALEFRDEGLIRVERVVDEAVAGQQLGEHQRALRGFIDWHLMRRLRGRLMGKPASVQQIQNTRSHLVAADAFLHWLADQDTSLSGCTQGEVEKYLNSEPPYPVRCGAFIRWAVPQRYAPAGIKAPAIRWTGPAGPHDQDARWAVARRLLHDDSLPTADRVAGLLVLLYAQNASSIHRLTADRVTKDGDHVLLSLGERPIRLPAPLDVLMSDLVASPASHAVLQHESEWLFPGRTAGHPIHQSQMLRRLRAIGVKTRQGRNTALFALAQQLPAGQLAKMIGVHISVAVAWQRASGGDWMAYAAAVAARSATKRSPARGKRAQRLGGLC
ncbi:site-specific integrase [Streptomyces sp. NPDC047917]|uniref:site-specific integrase n=1 Tax=Streptomyces sp. NPDC047917 TaxID=3365491 RepID=UPI0037240621